MFLFFRFAGAKIVKPFGLTSESASRPSKCSICDEAPATRIAQIMPKTNNDLFFRFLFPNFEGNAIFTSDGHLNRPFSHAGLGRAENADFEKRRRRRLRQPSALPYRTVSQSRTKFERKMEEENATLTLLLIKKHTIMKFRNTLLWLSALASGLAGCSENDEGGGIPAP